MEFIEVDLPPLLTALFSTMACALLGSYLLLRRMSLMGDAISHSVLPGIVLAFLFTTERTEGWVFIGAALAGVLSSALIEAVKRFGKVDIGASMGVVFSVFFASGVLLMEQAAAQSVDLDADCLLHGQLETIFWYAPEKLLSWETLGALPSEVFSSFITLILVSSFLVVCYKELQLVAFDPAHAHALGFRPTLLNQIFMILLACAVVASFKAVGSILVIAMLICPAASARMWTDRFLYQIILSALFAVLSSTLGYFLGAFGPMVLGYPSSVSLSGMIAVISGVLLVFSVVAAPYYGVIARVGRRFLLARRVREEDILALLYRIVEAGEEHKVKRLLSVFGLDILSRLALYCLKQEGFIETAELKMTPAGVQRARKLVRSHRLWETYLARELGLPPDHVHDTAEKLEHVTSASLLKRVADKQGSIRFDPHGKEIPPETS